MHPPSSSALSFVSLAGASIVLAALASACAAGNGASGVRSDHDLRSERAAGAGENSSDRGHNSQLDGHARGPGHHAHMK